MPVCVMFTAVYFKIFTKRIALQGKFLLSHLWITSMKRLSLVKLAQFIFKTSVDELGDWKHLASLK